jgi:hypothetical protein
LVSRSRNGLQWSAPVIVAAAAGGDDFDKPWAVCDNTPSSPFFGHCYAEFDDFGHADLIKMSTSTDGGGTWSAPLEPASGGAGLYGKLGIGGQPLVQPNGTVIVPIDNLVETEVRSFRSTDGGASWSSTVSVAPISVHAVAGGLRAGPLPSAEVDGAGRVYVVWQDCRFRAGCSSNDIVFSTSDDGTHWSPVSRVPIDPIDSGADHFIPGLALDPATSGSRARLALAYSYYPSATCTAATCQLDVGFIRSSDGGANWSAPSQLAGPMTLSWLPNTSQGVMVGDYITTSFVAGDAMPLFAVAAPPSGGLFDEAIYTTAGQPGPPEQPLQPALQATGITVPQLGETPAVPVTAR